MKKLFLLFAIALVVPVSISCGENDNRKKNAVFVTFVVVVGGALVYKYWWNKSPETPTPSADNPTPNTNNANPQQDIQEKLTPPVPAVPLNKVIPAPDVSDEDHKIVENALNASKKPTDTSAKPMPIICPPTKTEQPKILTPEPKQQSKPTIQTTNPQKPREFSLSNSFEKVSNRANPANIDHATNDYLDIIMGY